MDESKQIERRYVGHWSGSGGAKPVPVDSELRVLEPPADRSPDGSLGVLAGYAAVFDSDSNPIGGARHGFVEQIDPRAFSRSLDAGDDVTYNRDHDDSRLLGRTSSGTVRLSTDKTGLRAEVDIPDTPLGRETIELVRRGDIVGMSFAFLTRQDEFVLSEDPANPDRRRLLDVELIDVSAVVHPAYPAAALDAAPAVRAHRNLCESRALVERSRRRRKIIRTLAPGG